MILRGVGGGGVFVIKEMEVQRNTILVNMGEWMGWSAHCGCRCGFRPFSRPVESGASLADIGG